jgi:hypothetical protein
MTCGPYQSSLSPGRLGREEARAGLRGRRSPPTGHSLASIASLWKHYLAITPEFADTAIAKLMALMDREGKAA